MNPQLTHQELAELVGGVLIRGAPSGIVTGLASLADASPGDVSFLSNLRYAPQLKTSKATIVLVAPDLAELPEDKALIQVANPTLAFSIVIKLFGPKSKTQATGVHPAASVAENASLDRGKASMDDAKRQLDRAKRLWGEKLLADQDLEAKIQISVAPGGYLKRSR